MKEYEILLLGNSGVGKTSIFKRFIENKVENTFSSTIGVDFETKILTYKNKQYSIFLYDTAGQEKYKSIISTCCGVGDGYLIVFDLTNKKSLNSLNDWVKSVINKNKYWKFLIIGNKVDLTNDQIPENEINFFIKLYYLNIIYIIDRIWKIKFIL